MTPSSTTPREAGHDAAGEDHLLGGLHRADTDFPRVDALRKTVYEDLDKGLLMGLTMTIQEMEEMGNPVHHLTRDAQDYLLKRGIR